MNDLALVLNNMAKEILKEQRDRYKGNDDEFALYLARQIAVLQYFLISKSLTQEFEEFTTEALFDIQN